MHKLQGVTCYAALPRLRERLKAWPEHKQRDRTAVLEFSRQVAAELEAIAEELRTLGAA